MFDEKKCTIAFSYKYRVRIRLYILISINWFKQNSEL